MITNNLFSGQQSLFLESITVINFSLIQYLITIKLIEMEQQAMQITNFLFYFLCNHFN